MDLTKHELYKCFNPSAVAVIGATDRPKAVGQTVLANLLRCRQDENKFKIYPVNMNRNTCCGVPCFKTIADCPTKVDLAIIVIPVNLVEGVVNECGKAGVKFLIILSAGLKEMSEEGEKLEQDIVAKALSYNMRIIGPNCLGIMCPHSQLNATFAASDALPGSVAFISQSGALCTTVLDWSLRNKIGISAFISIGSMSDLAWHDLISYFGDDSKTSAIIIYMEAIGNSEKFLAAANAATKKKPIIVIKSGITLEAQSAAKSHTGSIAGSHDAFICAMKRENVILINDINELDAMANYLSKQPIPATEELCIITNAGGPGVLATDDAVLNNLKIHEFSQDVIDKLDKFLPSGWSHRNPVDILGDAPPEIYKKTLKVILDHRDKKLGCILIILSPQSVTEPTETAKALIELKSNDIPIICAWMGADTVSEGKMLLNAHGIPCFDAPNIACRILGKLSAFQKENSLMSADQNDADPTHRYIHEHIVNYRYSVLSDSELKMAAKEATKIFQGCVAEARSVLTEAESKNVLSLFKIPTCITIICSNVEEAVVAAEKIGYPVVIKLHSEKITHKSDVGGVHVNIKDKETLINKYNLIYNNLKSRYTQDYFNGVTIQPYLDIKGGYELILGSTWDKQYGHFVLFGFGGVAVEIFKDTCLQSVPLTPMLAYKQISSTKIFKAICSKDTKSRFLNLPDQKIIELMLRFSSLIETLSEYIQEIDLNPLLAIQEKSDGRLIALDARIALRSHLFEN